jgi:hypothetical protein
MKGAWFMAGEIFEGSGGFEGRFFRTRGHGHQVKLHGCQITGVLIKAHACQLSSDAKALEIRISAGVDISSKHTCSDEGDLDATWFFHK